MSNRSFGSIISLGHEESYVITNNISISCQDSVRRPEYDLLPLPGLGFVDPGLDGDPVQPPGLLPLSRQEVAYQGCHGKPPTWRGIQKSKSALRNNPANVFLSIRLFRFLFSYLYVYSYNTYFVYYLFFKI